MAGGLGDYGSDESEDDDERSVRGSESSDTDEEELRHRIREKQDAFRRKEREMQQLLEKQAQEALLARGKMFEYLCVKLKCLKMSYIAVLQILTDPISWFVFVRFYRGDGEGEIEQRKGGT